jgi:hypothetical protein
MNERRFGYIRMDNQVVENKHSYIFVFEESKYLNF